MKNLSFQSIVIVSGVVLYLILLGFFREHVFINLNYQISRIYYNNTFDYSLPDNMRWLESFSYKQLYYLKFPITLLFSCLYLIAAVVITKKFFPGKSNVRLTVYTYTGVFLLSLLIFLLGLIPGCYLPMYSISRYVMGFEESPLLVMVLVLAFRLNDYFNSIRT